MGGRQPTRGPPSRLSKPRGWLRAWARGTPQQFQVISRDRHGCLQDAINPEEGADGHELGPTPTQDVVFKPKACNQSAVGSMIRRADKSKNAILKLAAQHKSRARLGASPSAGLA